MRVKCIRPPYPEENEREGWFDRSRSDWGANGMTPDFTVRQKGGTE